MSSISKKIFHIIKESRKKENKSIFKIILELFDYSSRLGLSPGEYFTYGLQSKLATPSYCLDYMPNSVHFKQHLSTLNSPIREVLLDKILFKNAMQKAGIPVPGTIGYAGPNKINDLNFDLITPSTIHQILSSHKVTDFFVKPSKGTSGKGIFLVKYIKGNEHPFNIKDQAMNTLKFFEFLTNNCENPDHGYILFEHKICSCDTLKNISPDASPNIRIITLRMPNGEICITSASMRLGRKNSIVSNAGSGGMLAGIDIKNGSIVGCRTTSYIQGKLISKHPDTSAQIIGVKIPNWSGILSTCKKAASAIDSMNSVGWDVLLDRSVPVIIEGNDQWCMISEQLFGKGYLTSKNRELLAFYDLEFPKQIPKRSFANLKLAFFGS